MYRLPGQTPTAMKVSFAFGLVIFLGIYSGLPQMLDLQESFASVIDWIQCIPRGALMGLMIGIALGAAITGLRYIFSENLSAREDK